MTDPGVCGRGRLRLRGHGSSGAGAGGTRGGITASEGAGQRKTNGAQHRFHAGPISESETDAQTEERLAVAKEDGGPGRGAAGVWA